MLNTISISVSDDDEVTGRMRVRVRPKRKKPGLRGRRELLRWAVRTAIRWWPVLLFLPAVALLLLESSRLGRKLPDEVGDNLAASAKVESLKNLNRLDPTTRVVHGVCYVAFWDEITRATQEKEGKMLSHRLFPEARFSIWVDSKSQFRRDPIGVIEALLWRTNSVLAISEHGARSSLYDEGKAVVKKHKATPEEVEMQLNQYRMDAIPDDKRFNGKKALAEASVIVREHTASTNLFMCLWFNEKVNKTMASSASLISPSGTPISPSRSRSGAHRRPAWIGASSSSSADLPLRKIPGDYGLPFLGPLCDRLAYFYFEGRDQFFRSRIRRYGSTVFRVNVPPGPFVAPDPRVVALLDAASYPVLFDTSLVEKRDLFTGTFMPSTELTGGFRVLPYLDPAEPNHAQLKRLLFFLLASRRHAVVPEFRRSFGSLFEAMEAEIAREGKADFSAANDRAAFDFLVRCFFGTDPAGSRLDLDGPGLINKWVLFQLGPLLKLGLPPYLEDFLLHSFRLPPALVRADYDRLTDFFSESAGPFLDEAKRFGVSREEALHNVLFATCFNAFSGMKILFPSLIKWIGRAGARLHGRIAEEVRSAVRGTGIGKVTVRAVEAAMPLTRSVVYEALRVEPPMPLQYGRAKRDMVVASHDGRFEVHAGEVLFGYQPFATRDPRVFERAEEFVADRFVGAEGEALLRHVLWSNGPETEGPTTENKQCAGKDFVVMVARLLVVELFLRYDSFEIEVGASPLGSLVKLTSLKRATF
ncbi:hypothetical protein BHM03_00027147 [Ensete ventricosum]|nr:hypothetical protein BHM03_00027147 [Ensete ventricosum]